MDQAYFSRFVSPVPAYNLLLSDAQRFLSHLRRLGVPAGELELNEQLTGMAQASYVPLADVPELPTDRPFNFQAAFGDGNRHSIGKLYSEVWLKRKAEAGCVTAMAELLSSVGAKIDVNSILMYQKPVQLAANAVLDFTI